MATRRGGRRGGATARRSVSARGSRRASRPSKSRTSRSYGMGSSRGGSYSLQGVYRKAKKTLTGA